MAASKSSPPRWFVPILLLVMLAAAAGLVWMVVPLDQPAEGQIEIGDRSYIVPPAEISAIHREPSTFLRIRLPGKPFLIVHDQKLADRRHSSGVPLTFSVNDGAGHDVVFGRRGRSVVLCRRASNPVAGCRTWLEYGGTTWFVLFPERRAGEADKFVREALGALKRYDTRHRSRVL